MTQKWLVVSNCQTAGLGNSLSLLCPKAKVETCDIWKFNAEWETWRERLPSYDHVLLNPHLPNLEPERFAAFSNVTWLPGLIFGAFHPDLVAVFSNNSTWVRTPLGFYNSLIVVTAFKAGLPEEKAVELFREETYRRLGFLDRWETEKTELFSHFDRYGWDIRSAFAHWTRSGCFMHSSYHPRIEALYELSRVVARRLVEDGAVDSGIHPIDNLTAGAIYPVYPEIAEQYGIANGHYFFKPPLTFSLLSLSDFVAASYESYRGYDLETLDVPDHRHDHAGDVIRALA